MAVGSAPDLELIGGAKSVEDFDKLGAKARVLMVSAAVSPW